MNAAGMKMLERLFAAEVLGRLPFQSKAKIIKRLHEEGYIQPMKTAFKDRFGIMVIDGWQLTHAGRLTYCMSCDEPESK